MPSQKLLRELWDYDPETGVVTWKKSIGSTRKGREVGTPATGRHSHLSVGIGRKKYLVHRLIWVLVYGSLADDEQIDHINHDPADNRLCNLRKVTAGEHAKNQVLRTDNKSGRVGVFWDKYNKAWVAKLQVRGIQYCLGYFQKLEDAIAAREVGEREHGFHPNHGSYRGQPVLK